MYGLLKYNVLPLRRGSTSSFKNSHRRVLSLTHGNSLVVSEEVTVAIQCKKPVVALETTIYTHGFPYPDNIALSSSLESIVREHGGVPATIGILNGVAKVGLSAEEIIELLEKAGKPDTVKVSRRDLGFICGMKRYYGGTTIAGTLILAHLAGIKVFATGGLGGVHRDKSGETSMDVSADLTELGRTPLALVSSGCKSFLDIPRTLEYLETQGVGVGTFADGRKGPVKFPAFWTRESDFDSPNVITDEKEAAAILHAQLSLPLTSGLLFANPIPAESSLPKDTIDQITLQAIKEAADKGYTGSSNTPYILSRIRELTNGGTVSANRSLVESNVARGTKVAVELARIELASTETLNRACQGFPKTFRYIGSKIPSPVDVLVAGSIALDLSCEYSPLEKHVESIAPYLKTSNPASITQSLGGVGRNVATASHYLGARTILCSMVGDDAAGSALIELLKKDGLDAKGVLVAPYGSRTAQYVAITDIKKDMMMAMADMKILETRCENFDNEWNPFLAHGRPKWLVLDANWNAETLQQWITAAKLVGAKIAYEPVSVEKSIRLWELLPSALNQIVDLTTPNEMELGAMAAGLNTQKVGEPLANRRLVDLIWKGIDLPKDLIGIETISSAIKLLPHIPCVLTKLGPRGVLQIEALQLDDPRLIDIDARRHIVFASAVKNLPGRFDAEDIQIPNVKAVYVKHHAAKEVKSDKIVSVNGVGDTFLGVVVATLSKNIRATTEEAIEIAQHAASLTLMSPEAVNPAIRCMEI